MYSKLEPLNDEERKFVGENHNLIYSFLRKYGFSMEEYYDIAALGLIEAVKRYDPSRGVFSNFAYLCMLNKVRMEMRKVRSRNKRIETISLNIELEKSSLEDLLPAADTVESIYLHNWYVERIEKLPEKLRTVALLLASGYNQIEIAKRLGYSQSYISRLVVKIRKIICDGCDNCDKG